MQPNPSVFFKSFLEFDASNLVSLLSFDSRAMKHLLQDDFSNYFDPKYPLIYKNKFLKSNGRKSSYYYKNAIEQSINNNQVFAAELLRDYIVKYQNNVMSSFLLGKCLTRLI
jgi:hypothetical protein